HRVEILNPYASPLLRPECEPLELGAEPQGARAEPLDEKAGGTRLELEAELSGLGDQLLGHLPLPGRIEREDLPARGLDGLRNASRRLSVRHQGEGGLVRNLPEAIDGALGVGLPPVL